jgi:hypothetical protein
MDQVMNTLPIQNYVRQRVQTIVVDVGEESSGSIPFTLEKPSDVTLIIASNGYDGAPTLFVGAIGREPSLDVFDVILSPIDATYVKYQSRMTLHLPQGTTTFQWKGLSLTNLPEAFPEECSRLVLVIDQ